MAEDRRIYSVCANGYEIALAADSVTEAIAMAMEVDPTLTLKDIRQVSRTPYFENGFKLVWKDSAVIDGVWVPGKYEKVRA